MRTLVFTAVTVLALAVAGASRPAATVTKTVRITASGFNPTKCKVMASVKAPIDVVGTGSYLPQRWTETYATADIIAYDGEPRVKVGREFLLRRKPADR